MDKITAETIKALIARRYNPANNAGKYAIFFELNQGTGTYAGGKIDSFVMNLWPSENFLRYAFEIKVSRNDLMHELDNPSKRKWALDISNEFWFVCAPGIVEKQEIPENCGLMVATKNASKLMIKKRAPFREANDLEPWEIASIIRSAARMQNLPDEFLWKYRGQELTDADLDEVLTKRRAYHEQQEIESKAKEQCRELFRQQNSNIQQLAKFMREAGIEPPEFMDTEYRGFFNYSNVKHWVDKHFVIGPDAVEIRSAIKEMKNADLAVKAARDRMISLVNKKEKSDDKQETIG